MGRRISRWALGYIERLHENSRYWAIVGYMNVFKCDGEYLDVGCGTGGLYDRFKMHGYQRFAGIDISDVGINALRSHNDDRTNFAQADADTYEPSGRFDIIVFNESLYYLRDPIRSLQRYAKHLKAGGCIIVSTYTSSRRSLAVLRQAKRAFDVIDETETTQGEVSWLCTVLKSSGPKGLAVG